VRDEELLVKMQTLMERAAEHKSVTIQQ
jgi:hypothetical protein